MATEEKGIGEGKLVISWVVWGSGRRPGNTYTGGRGYYVTFEPEVHGKWN